MMSEKTQRETHRGQVPTHRDLSPMRFDLSPLTSKEVILASASPRRTELLKQAGIEHVIMPSECEEIIKSNIPQDVVQELAGQKAWEVYQRYLREHRTEDFLVIGADTVVALDGKILGKPKDETDAFGMLSLLQGREHQVYTGVSLIRYEDGAVLRKSFYECSNVQVYPVSEKEIYEYIASGEPLDKAGAYGIQGRFAVHIRGLEGDYNNIVGLPIARIYHEIKVW